MPVNRKKHVKDDHARQMYDALKRQLGKRRALRVSGLTRRGMGEQDLYPCTLPARVKTGIQLSFEKHVRGINHSEEAKNDHF